MNRDRAAWILLSLCVMGVPAAARAQGCGPANAIDPLLLPQQTWVKPLGEDFVLQRTTSTTVCYTVMKTVNQQIEVERDGQKRFETITKAIPVTMCKPVIQTQEHRLALRDVKFWDMAGAEVEPAQVRERLGAGGAALFATRKIPAYYLAVFKPDTLLIEVSPQALMPQPVILPVPRPAPPSPVSSAPVPNAPVANAPVANAPVAAPAPAPANPPVAAPGITISAEAKPMHGPQPSVQLATLAGDKLGLRTHLRVRSSETSYVEKLTDQGQKQRVPFSIETESIQDVERFYPTRVIQVATAAGQEVAATELPKLLSQTRCVLVSSDGQPISEEWLKLVRPTALLITPPAMPAPMMAPPVAAPAPAASPASVAPPPG
jgi:hypothetical protein